MSEFRLMRAKDSTVESPNARIILPIKGNILPTPSDKVGTLMRRRLPPSEVLSRNLKEAGEITVPTIVRRAEAKGYSISKNTINYILNGNTKNPGIFTIEDIAVAIDKAPEQLAAEFLGIRSDDTNFKGSQFAMLYEIYRGLSPAQKQKAAPHIDSLLLMLQHIKNQ
jgi:transcriptional regulator with XRE-family HTH domain